jgi:hypothetical protein
MAEPNSDLPEATVPSPTPPAASKPPKAGINTNQLTALWYGTLLMFVALCISTGATENPLWVILGIALLVALVVYTLKPPGTARPRTVLLRVAVPIILLVTLGGVSMYVYDRIEHQKWRTKIDTDRMTTVPPEFLETYDFTLSGYGTLKGWIKNNSDISIHHVTIRIAVTNKKGDLFESEDVQIGMAAKPGMAARISESVNLPALLNLTSDKESYSWSFRVQTALSRDPGPAKRMMDERPEGERAADLRTRIVAYLEACSKGKDWDPEAYRQYTEKNLAHIRTLIDSSDSPEESAAWLALGKHLKTLVTLNFAYMMSMRSFGRASDEGILDQLADRKNRERCHQLLDEVATIGAMWKSYIDQYETGIRKAVEQATPTWTESQRTTFLNAVVEKIRFSESIEIARLELDSLEALKEIVAIRERQCLGEAQPNDEARLALLGKECDDRTRRQQQIRSTHIEELRSLTP